MQRRRVITVILALVTFGAALAFGQERSPDRDIDAKAAQPIRAVLGKLNQAWNAADGGAFASQFTADADVININGTHFRGQPDLAKQMQLIFDTVFKGSKHSARTLEVARYLSEDTILAVSSAVIEVPRGPLAPEARSRQTIILVSGNDTWKIRHWHNTPIRRERTSAR